MKRIMLMLRKVSIMVAMTGMAKNHLTLRTRLRIALLVMALVSLKRSRRPERKIPTVALVYLMMNNFPKVMKPSSQFTHTRIHFGS